MKVKNLVLQYEEFGDPLERLALHEMEITPLQPNEVLVKMIASPINPSDLIPIRGSYSHRISLPFIAGYEGVGVIVDVGKNTSASLIGKRVLPLRGEGTWQQFVKSPSEFVIQVPDSFSNAVASQLYINPLTAWIICSEYLALKPGDTLLMNAGGSAIARFFTQLSNILGFSILLVIRNEIHRNELYELGAWKVFNSSTANINEAVMDVTGGKGVDVSIDSVGGESGELLAKCLKQNGRYLSLGLLSGIQVDWEKINKEFGIPPDLFSLRRWNQLASTSRWHQKFTEIIDLILKENIKLAKINGKYKFKDFKHALHHTQIPGNKGKVLLTHDLNDIRQQ